MQNHVARCFGIFLMIVFISNFGFAYGETEPDANLTKIVFLPYYGCIGVLSRQNEQNSEYIRLTGFLQSVGTSDDANGKLNRVSDISFVTNTGEKIPLEVDETTWQLDSIADNLYRFAFYSRIDSDANMHAQKYELNALEYRIGSESHSDRMGKLSLIIQNSNDAEDINDVVVVGMPLESSTLDGIEYTFSYDLIINDTIPAENLKADIVSDNAEVLETVLSKDEIPSDPEDPFYSIKEGLSKYTLAVTIRKIDDHSDEAFAFQPILEILYNQKVYRRSIMYGYTIDASIGLPDVNRLLISAAVIR